MSHAIRIWEKPTETGVYAIGGDPAEGLERGDDSVLEVINCKTGIQAAEVQGKIEPVLYGELAYMLGTFYNNALIGIESNKDLTPVKALFGLSYPNLYMEMAERGRAYRSATDRLGWQTNLRTRPQLIAQGRAFMADVSVTCKSRALTSQFKSFALHMGKFQTFRSTYIFVYLFEFSYQIPYFYNKKKATVLVLMLQYQTLCLDYH